MELSYNFSGIEAAVSASTEFDGIKATEAGDNGNDVAMMGAGDDVFQWDPGDGVDTVSRTFTVTLSNPTSSDAFDFQTSEPTTSEGGTTVVPPIGKYQAMLDQANVDVDNDVVTLNSGSASTSAMQPTIRFRDLDVWTQEQPQPDAFDFKAMEESEAAGTQVKTFLCPSNRTSLDGDGVDDLATYQPDTTAIGPGESFTYTLDPREVGASDGADYSGSHLLYQDVMIPTLDTGSWLM